MWLMTIQQGIWPWHNKNICRWVLHRNGVIILFKVGNVGNLSHVSKATIKIKIKKTHKNLRLYSRKVYVLYGPKIPKILCTMVKAKVNFRKGGSISWFNYRRRRYIERDGCCCWLPLLIMLAQVNCNLW